MAFLIGLALLAAAQGAEAADPEVVVLDLLAYERPINLGDTPLAEAREGVRRNPRSADAWHALGEALDAAGNIEWAIGAYEKATKLPPRDIGRAYLYRDLAEAKERSGDLPGALAAARVSVRTWPKSREGLHCAGYEEKMLTRILVENRDVAGAIAFYRPLAQADPDVAECRAIGEALAVLLERGPNPPPERMRED